jgi:hypothetical protein|tara:strand:- start:297 stop:527 length:231 start_codon:yes stop_codon:yes gene_type:complete
MAIAKRLTNHNKINRYFDGQIVVAAQSGSVIICFIPGRRQSSRTKPPTKGRRLAQLLMRRLFYRVTRPIRHRDSTR